MNAALGSKLSVWIDKDPKASRKFKGAPKGVLVLDYRNKKVDWATVLDATWGKRFDPNTRYLWTMTRAPNVLVLVSKRMPRVSDEEVVGYLPKMHRILM